MALSNPLKAITQRLNGTSVEELPRYAGFLASSVLGCAEVLRRAEAQKGDTSVLLHKLKTRVSSLLQDKTQEGRFTGIVMVKAIVDAGGVQVLSTSGGWARNLLSCLNKQDPPEVKKLCLITITKIFLLTKNHPSLVREITTPALPTFISTTLALIRPVSKGDNTLSKQVISPLLQTVLQCWIKLMHQYPSTFRPSINAIRSIVLKLLSSEDVPNSIRPSASEILAALHFCAPKNTASTEWTQLCQQIIEAAHQTADVVFRSVIEEWSSIGTSRPVPSNNNVSAEPSIQEPDAVGMDSWTGLSAGCYRLTQLLCMLKAVLVQTHIQPINLPLASVLDLTARLTAVAPPKGRYSLRQNQEIGRDERESLWSQLSRIHGVTLDLLTAVSVTFGQVLQPVSQLILSQICELHEAGGHDQSIRIASYTSMVASSQEVAVCFGAENYASLVPLIKNCCDDLRDGSADPPSKEPTNGTNKTSKSASLALETKNNSTTTEEWDSIRKSDVYQAAWKLLPIIFMNVSSILTSSLRAELDSTAILIGHTEAMLASVLNPPNTRKGASDVPSILPFLTRIHTESLSREALIRPRMPVITTQVIKPQQDTSERDDESEDLASETHSDGISMSAPYEESEEIEQPTDGITTNTTTPLPPKKRDFASIEPDPAATAALTTSIKRLRARDQLLDPTSSTTEPTDVETTTVTLQSSTDDKDIEPLTSLSTALAEHQKSTQQASPPATRQSTRSAALEVESDDDDEIPTIDATLTSDEEDEDEDGMEGD